MAFKAPTDISPFLPPANVVKVIQVVPSSAPGTDEYDVVPQDGSPSYVMYLTAGTTNVNSRAAAILSFNKFKIATLPIAPEIR